MDNQPLHSTPVKKYATPGFSEHATIANHSGSSSSGMISMGDLEISTVEKQRKELQLLITELKDRDRELNEMVAAHQQQLTAWERDRQKVILLEKKNEKFESELKKRAEQIRLLIQRLKVSESKHKSKDTALEATQARMKQLEKDVLLASDEVQNLKSENVSLNSSVTGLSSKLTSMESKEHELTCAVKTKENELRQSTEHVATLSSKLRLLDAELQDCKRSESRSRTEVQDERSRHKQMKLEVDSLKVEMMEKTNEMLSYRRDVSKLKDEIHRLQKEIYLRDDEIRRKDDLINLQKSKQDRADKELAALRIIYERQQDELTALHITLSDSQDIIEKQEERINQISRNGVDLSDFDDCGSDTTNDLLEEARKSATSDIVLQSEADDAPYPPRQTLSQSSPTSKLQKLLAESREMVHNLERAATSPVPRPSSARAATGHAPY